MAFTGFNPEDLLEKPSAPISIRAWPAYQWRPDGMWIVSVHTSGGGETLCIETAKARSVYASGVSD